MKRPGWKETTHPDARNKGHRTFENEETGEKLRHDEGGSEESGHEKHDHYQGYASGSDIVQEFVSFEQMQKNTKVYGSTGHCL